jgi:hypothetical protein
MAGLMWEPTDEYLSGGPQTPCILCMTTAGENAKAAGRSTSVSHKLLETALGSRVGRL